MELINNTLATALKLADLPKQPFAKSMELAWKDYYTIFIGRTKLFLKRIAKLMQQKQHQHSSVLIIP